MPEKRYSGRLPALGEDQVIDLAPGIRVKVPSYFSSEDNEGYDVELVLDVDEDHQLTTEAITVRRRPGGRGVDGAALRNIRVAELFQAAASNALQLKNDSDETGRMTLHPVALLAEQARQAMSIENPRSGPGGSLREELLKAVSTFYTAAKASGLPPQKYVMDALEVPRSTAGYWIAQARKRGLLAPASRSTPGAR